ncbi:MAG: YaiI/YqxD family protein [Hyphomonadaceae bacterium]
MNGQTSPQVRILVDGDACPVKDEIYKVAVRHTVPVLLVANSWIRMPDHPLFTFKLVSDGFDAADDYLAEQATKTDIAITADIPLADRCLKAGATVLGPRGRPFTENSIGGALATRAIMADLRVGVGNEQIGGAAPFSKSDRSSFLQALDKAIVNTKREATRG